MQPAIGEESIANEKHDDAGDKQQHRMGTSRNKTKVYFVRHQVNTPRFRQHRYIIANFAFRAGVVQHDDFDLAHIFRGQYTLDAGAGLGYTAINRDDYVDFVQGKLSWGH